jgi:hypothetical protein
VSACATAVSFVADTLTAGRVVAVSLAATCAHPEDDSVDNDTPTLTKSPALSKDGVRRWPRINAGRAGRPATNEFCMLFELGSATPPRTKIVRHGIVRAWLLNG